MKLSFSWAAFQRSDNRTNLPWNIQIKTLFQSYKLLTYNDDEQELHWEAILYTWWLRIK